MDVAILKQIIKETDKNWRFIFESPLYNKIDFIPGQLVQLVCRPGEENSVVRNYSVASWPDGTNCFELIITYLEGGAMSEYLFKEAKVGDEFVYRGPMGVFTLTNDIEVRDIFFVSTGSGISPFRSMLGWLNANKIDLKHIVLETDAPYLAPVPHRGKQNQPAYVVEVAKHLASIRGTSVAEIAQQSSDNFHRLFPRTRKV